LNAVASSGTTWFLRKVPAPRPLPLLYLGLVWIIYFGITCYLQLLAVRDPQTWFLPAAWFPEATAGLINVTSAYTLPLSLVLIGGLLIGIYRIRPSEIGLDVAKLPAALVLIAILWAINQILLVSSFALLGQEIALNREWTDGRWSWEAGQWIGQLCGNTFLEEVLFRGFLLPQCILLMRIWMPIMGPRMHIFAALVLSQGLFALPHVFFNANQPEGQWLLLAQFVMGLMFAGVYIQTGNLFLAIGVHTLANNPGPLLADSLHGIGLGAIIMMACTFLAVVVGPVVVPWWSRKR
jgi:uncharacterized protein